MYAKARAGILKGFTGIDDPYETPESSELKIDTTNISPEQAVQEVMLYLEQKRFYKIVERLDYNTVLNTAIDISKKAGKKIMEIYNNVDIDISFKDDNSSFD